MKKEILRKYLDDTYSPEEWEIISQWIEKESLSEESVKWAKQEWYNISKSEDTIIDDDDYNNLLYKIHHKININDQLDLQNHPFKNRMYDFSRWLTRAAAILLLPVLGILFFTLKGEKENLNPYAQMAVDSIEIKTPTGSRTHVQLSDGTEIYLNYGSKIKYPQYFTGNTREVTLSGEGYFKIAHNPDKPFIVKAHDLNIKALGTEFNVQSYPDEKEINTSLVNGKVVIEQIYNNRVIRTLGSMVPDQNISYNKGTKEIKSTKGNIEKYLAWKDGKLIFEDESIEEITVVLSRMFNVDFEIRDEVKFYTYTVTFLDEHLYQILDLMKIATPITYKSIPRKKLPDGSYSKTRIIIEKK